MATDPFSSFSSSFIALKEFDEINSLRTAKKKGFEKGIEKGKKEAMAEIAKNLLDILDNETIALKTGLSESEIQSLRK